MWRFEFSIDEISIVNFTHFQVKMFRPVGTHVQVDLQGYPRTTSSVSTDEDIPFDTSRSGRVALGDKESDSGKGLAGTA